MTLTPHGHHIPGSSTDDEDPNAVKARCGGPSNCKVCLVSGLAWVQPPLFKVGDRVRVTKSMLYTGRVGVVQENSGLPDDPWDFNVLLDADDIQNLPSRTIGIDSWNIEDETPTLCDICGEKIPRGAIIYNIGSSMEVIIACEGCAAPNGSSDV